MNDNGAWHDRLAAQETDTHAAWLAHRQHDHHVERDRADQQEVDGPELEIRPR